jgi:hypothetical protein
MMYGKYHCSPASLMKVAALILLLLLDASEPSGMMYSTTPRAGHYAEPASLKGRAV